MSEEEFINRIINRISKDYGAVMANELKYIIIRKEKEIDKQKEVLDKIKEKLHNSKEYKMATAMELNKEQSILIDIDKLLEEIE